MAAVEKDRLARHVVGRRRGQVHEQGPDLLEPSGAARGNVAQEPLAYAGVIERLGVHVGHEPAGGDRVDLHVVARPLDAQGARERDHAALGGGVRGVSGQARRAEHRGEIDDLARLLGDQPRGGRSAPVEHADQVHLDRAAELFGRHLGHRADVGDARVVHEDVEPSQPVDRALDQGFHLRVLGHVGRNREGAPAAPLDLVGRLFEVGNGASGQRDVGARLGEGQGHRPPEAAARAGNDGDLAVQPERVHRGAIGRGNRARLCASR